MAEAWVTLATNDTYAIGALVMAESLRRVKTTKQLHIMITKQVTQPLRDVLGKFFNAVTEVNVLDSRDEANLALIKRPELGITFTKLSCWTLTQYQKAVFLDADALILQNPDELFEYPELSAAPDIGWPDCFNSGVFVFVPSNETYHALVEHGVKQGSFDGGDQGLLNSYFSDWNQKGPSHRLPFIYNMSSNVVYNYKAAYKHFAQKVKIVHFLGAVKPWHHSYDTNTRRLMFRGDSYSHHEHVETWWQYFAEAILPSLTPETSMMAPPPAWFWTTGSSADHHAPSRIPFTPPDDVKESLSQFAFFDAQVPPPEPVPAEAMAALISMNVDHRPPELPSRKEAEWWAEPTHVPIAPKQDWTPPQEWYQHQPAPQQDSSHHDIVTTKFGIVEDHFATAELAPQSSSSSAPAYEPQLIRITFPLPLFLRQGGGGDRGTYVPPPQPSWRRETYHPPQHDDCPICRSDGQVSIEAFHKDRRWEEEPRWEPPQIERAIDKIFLANLLTACETNVRGTKVEGQKVEAASRVQGLQTVGGEEHQAAWERGNVEYLGRDSWDNIQKHLDQSTSKK